MDEYVFAAADGLLDSDSALQLEVESCGIPLYKLRFEFCIHCPAGSAELPYIDMHPVWTAEFSDSESKDTLTSTASLMVSGTHMLFDMTLSFHKAGMSLVIFRWAYHCVVTLILALGKAEMFVPHVYREVLVHKPLGMILPSEFHLCSACIPIHSFFVG